MLLSCICTYTLLLSFPSHSGKIHDLQHLLLGAIGAGLRQSNEGRNHSFTGHHITVDTIVLANRRIRMTTRPSNNAPTPTTSKPDPRLPDKPASPSVPWPDQHLISRGPRR
ncbi:hypothetical protein ACFX12_033920 [Malus domestica]